MQDAWRDKWQPRNVFPSSRPATSVLGVSLAINPLENRWPIKSRVQGEPSLINADCQGASLMYFSFKESVSNAHGFFFFSSSFLLWRRAVFFLCRLFAEAEWEELKWRDSANPRLSILLLFYGWDVYLHRALVNRTERLCEVQDVRTCSTGLNPVKLVVVLTVINTSRPLHRCEPGMGWIPFSHQLLSSVS